MTARKRRPLTWLAWTAVAIAASLDYTLFAAAGSQAPAWLHLWCSAGSPPGGSQGAGGANGALAAAVEGLRVHWPHLLPIPIATGTLAYLRRASVRHATAQRRSPVA